jgi:hypothetical protein
MSARSHEYILVRGRIKEIRAKSILFAVGESVERGDWIPRTLIHGADERTLDARFAGEEVNLRVFAWKARELGFDAETTEDGTQEELFP